jgi:hypothetical protein
MFCLAKASRGNRRWAVGLLGGAAFIAAGCRAGGPEAGLAAGNPMDRARAVIQVTEQRDGEAVQKLVDLLEDSDAAVRMYAILGLRRLVGEDYGYRYYDARAERVAAVQRWRAALRAGEVRLIGTAEAGGAEPALAGGGAAGRS